MKLKDLTPEQKAALKAEMAAEEKQADIDKASERKLLKDMSAKSVDTMFLFLTKASSSFSIIKGQVYDEFNTLIDLKLKLYKVKDNQRSHTFTNKKGDKRITLGYRILVRYDDTLDVGIEKIREYLETLATDGKSAKQMAIINNLLKKDTKGLLKPARVLDLMSLENEMDSELFSDGVEIIKQSYKPEKSSYFIEAEYKDDKQKWQTVPLSVSSVDFPTKEIAAKSVTP